MVNFDLASVETPCIVCDLGVLRRNLELLADVQRRAECEILLALKGFAMWSVFPLVRQYLPGVAASSLHEARLGREQFGGQVHVCAPAYAEADFPKLLTLADYVVFNSLSQYARFQSLLAESGRRVSCGLRINPEHSEVQVALYDPCQRYSRLGVTRRELSGGSLEGIAGLHFHTLCEQGVDALERTLAAVEMKFSTELQRVSWVNFGGGHQITQPGYERERLVSLVRGFSQRHGVRVYLEPSEAIALNAGVLVASVLDIIHNEVSIAIVDTSASAHMPDVLEMPYRPDIVGAGTPEAHPYRYRLGGLTCLAGDFFGEYSFVRPLRVGDRLAFADMAHYTMVKSSCFNGIRLPSIATFDPDTSTLRVVRHFDYEDYRSRLS
jgi:carboxynorspermidine decarboxylase